MFNFEAAFREETTVKKVIIQIPCYNEEKTLPITLAELPRALPGVDKVEWLVINDGSTDNTVEVARRHGVDHIVSFPRNRGLARAFSAGLDACLKAGADIIVNTDADNQYRACDIPNLIRPIQLGQCEMVMGARPIGDMKQFSLTKKLLQKLGSWVVRVVSGTDVPDAPSGFRAISRYAALRLNVFDNYTYTLETIIQAGKNGIPIMSIPVGVNGDLRPSRLVKNIPQYVLRSILTILRIFLTYDPLRFFLITGAFPMSIGVILCIRWLILQIMGAPTSHVPSLVMASVALFVGIQMWIFGLVANLTAVNRRLLEDIQVRVRDAESDHGTDKESADRIPRTAHSHKTIPLKKSNGRRNSSA